MRLRLDSLAFGGDAVGRSDDGKVCFVPRGAPGDVVELRVLENRKDFRRAAIDRVIEPGPARRAARCAHFDAGCGGCQWLHVTEDAQRAAKADAVARALRGLPFEIRPLLAPVPALGWRRRVRLGVLREGASARLGLRRLRGHEVHEVPGCPQWDPRLEALVRELPALLGTASVDDEVSAIVGVHGAAHLLVEGPGSLAVEPAVAAGFAAAGWAGAVLDDGTTRRELGTTRIVLEEDAGAPFHGRADVFAQSSAAGNAALRALVRGALGAPRETLELYAGSGNFTRDLIAAGHQVVAVEDAPRAVALGRDNLASAAALTWVVASAAVGLATHGATARLVVVDPPRTGLGHDVTSRLSAAAAERVIYVSCDPATFARDARALVAGGFTRGTVTPLDLMPQTYHVELVGVFDRG